MIGNLVNHRADAYHRGSETVGSHGQATPALSEGPEDFTCSVLVDGERVSRAGPGELTVGAYRVTCPNPKLDIHEKDVIHVHTGPEAPLLLEVESRSAPLGRFLALRCATWKGELPE